MKTSLASERAGGIARPTLNSLTFTRFGAAFVGQAFSPMPHSFPGIGQLQGVKRSYQVFDRPLPCGHGSVESVRYRAVTAIPQPKSE